MSLVFTFLNATNQAKAMTLEGALDFHKNLARWNGIESDKLVKAKKNDFTKNTPKEEGIQAFSSKTKGDKCTRERKVINLLRSSISKLVGL